MKLSTGFAVLLAGLLTTLAGVAQGDLIVNGDFETGGGFQSDYTEVTLNNSSTPQGRYALTLKPANWNTRFASFGDHTTADLRSGQMLLVNGSTNSANRVWAQSVSVQAGRTYDISFWASNALMVSNSVGRSLVADTPPNLVFEVDGTPLFAIDLTGKASGTWTQGSGQFTALSTGRVNLQIRDLVTASYGNDFAIDDVWMAASAIPEPSSLALFGIGSVVAIGVYSLRRRRANTV